MQTVLVDTCVWYAIFDPRDRPDQRGDMVAIAQVLETMKVLVPWPVTYETMCTRFTSNRVALQGFERLLKQPQVQLINDDKYRDGALSESFEWSLRRGRPLSLTDCLLRRALVDIDLKINCFATFNVRDFRDICAPRGIELFPDDEI